MAFSFLQFASANPGANQNPTLAYGSNVAANSILLAVMRLGDTTTDVSSITDTVTSTWTQVIAPQIQTTDGHRLLMWKGLVAGGAGANTVQFNFSAVPGSCRMSVYEWSADGTQVQDTGGGVPRSGQQDGTTTPNTGGNLTPSQANELLVAAVSMGNAPSVAGSGSFTTRYDDGDGFKHGLVDWIQGSATATDAGITLGASDNAAVILAAFKMVAAGGDTLFAQSIF